MCSVLPCTGPDESWHEIYRPLKQFLPLFPSSLSVYRPQITCFPLAHASIRSLHFFYFPSYYSFTVPGSGAPMPRYRYVNPSPLLLPMRQSDLFISATSPLTSFRTWQRCTDGYWYVTPSPFSFACVNPIPSLLLLPLLPVLPYLAPGHRCLDVSAPVWNPFPPTLFSVLLRKPVRAKRPV